MWEGVCGWLLMAWRANEADEESREERKNTQNEDSEMQSPLFAYPGFSFLPNWVEIQVS